MNVMERRVDDPAECPFRSEGYRSIFDITDEGYRCGISTKCCKEQLRAGDCPLKCTDVLVKGEYSNSPNPQTNTNLEKAHKILENIEYETNLMLFLIIEYNKFNPDDCLPTYTANLELGELVESSNTARELCGYGYDPTTAVINYVHNLLGKELCYVSEDDDLLVQFSLDMEGIVSNVTIMSSEEAAK